MWTGRSSSVSQLPIYLLPRIAAIIAFVAAFVAAFVSAGIASAAEPDPFDGKWLYADVEHYASLGNHQFGTLGDVATTSWLAGDLQAAGLTTSFQSFELAKQYALIDAGAEVMGQRMSVLPFWWPPEQAATFELNARIAADGTANATGMIVWMRMPFDGGAYISERQRTIVATAAKRSPSAIILSIDSPSGDEYAYNVAQQDNAWPVPVFIVGAKYAERLEKARSTGARIELRTKGRYFHDVTGHNVVARLNRGASKTVVISTPTTGWFTCACERGPGIAIFLALARAAAQSKHKVNYVFVATTGHEIGHGGMERFMHDGAPKPADTLAWIHLGSSLACYEWQLEGERWTTNHSVDPRRTLFFTSMLEQSVSKAFRDVPVIMTPTADRSPAGELRDVHAAGYRQYVGMAAGHRFFHTPNDDVSRTGPEALEPIARAFEKMMDEIINANE